MRTELGTSFLLELFLLYAAQLARPRGDSEATLWATLPRLLLLLLRLLLLLFTIKVCLAATCVANSLRALAADTQREKERKRGAACPFNLHVAATSIGFSSFRGSRNNFHFAVDRLIGFICN